MTRYAASILYPRWPGHHRSLRASRVERCQQLDSLPSSSLSAATHNGQQPSGRRFWIYHQPMVTMSGSRWFGPQ